MLIHLDGKPLTTAQQEYLLDAVGFRTVYTSMHAKGYRLAKIRLPRRFPASGRLTIRFVWSARDAAGHQVTVRMSGTVDVDPG